MTNKDSNMSSLFARAEMANQWATERQDDGGAAHREKKRAEAEALQNFHMAMFGKTQENIEWQKKQQIWTQHCAAVDSKEDSFNWFIVTFPTSLWSKDPTGREMQRQPGPIDRAEFELETVSLRCYRALHGQNSVPSGLPAWTNTSGGDSVEGGFIVDAETARDILDRASLAWDKQAAKVRILKQETEEKLCAALNPWRWNENKVDQELVDRIETALTMRTPRSDGVRALFGEGKTETSFVGEGVDSLLERAIRFDGGQGSDRSLIYALTLTLKDNEQYKGRWLMAARELNDQALFDLFSFKQLYGPYARDKRIITKLQPIHVPEFVRYGTQEQLEAQLAELTK